MQNSGGGGGRVRGEDIRQLLAEQFAVTYSLNGVYDLLKPLDMAWISGRSISPHADPVKKAKIKKFVQQVEAVLPIGLRLEQVDIWLQDEMRIGQRGTQTRLCCEAWNKFTQIRGAIRSLCTRS